MKKRSSRLLVNKPLRSSVCALVLALSALPWDAEAASLGRIMVFSAQGQALRAEIDVNATPAELAEMRVRQTVPDASVPSELALTPARIALLLTLDKRPNGRTVLKLSSEQPVNERLNNVWLELSWPSGRVVREYFFLLDPVSLATTETPAIDAPLSQGNQDSQGAKNAGSAHKEALPAGDSYAVKRGDTLFKIALQNKPADVSLDQMLVGLYHANKGAFSGNNMNRLQAGKVLVMPVKEDLDGMSNKEAKQVVATQTRDWHAYRQKLATAAGETPQKSESTGQAASGKITPRVEEQKALTPPTKDQVKVSREKEASKKRPAKSAKLDEEDLIAKEKALKEANERIEILKKQNEDLDKLISLQNERLAELEKTAQQQLSAQAKPEENTTPGEEEKKTERHALDNASSSKKTYLIGGAAAGLVVVLGGLWAVLRRRKRKNVDAKDAVADSAPRSEAAPEVPPDVLNDVAEKKTPAELAPAAAIVAAEMAEPTETAAEALLKAPPEMRDLAPAETDPAEEEVDPLAKADIYLAYGRQERAEEVLLAAHHDTPERYDITLKLLELYFDRQDSEAFVPLANDLHEVTGGSGTDWQTAASMGRQLLPDHPLFVEVAAPRQDIFATPALEAPDLPLDLPADLPPEVSDADDEPPPAAPVTPAQAEPVAMDFDLMLPPSLDTSATPPAFDMRTINLDLADTVDSADHTPISNPPTQAHAPRLSEEERIANTMLDMGHAPDAATEEPPSDDIVATKLDLAKAYEEMGDFEGANELLQEITNEGNAEQIATAQAMLAKIKS